MSAYLYEKIESAIVQADGTITLEANQSCWHNQLIISRGTATAGTLTIKYKVGGKIFSLKDQYGTAITMATLPTCTTATSVPIRSHRIAYQIRRHHITSNGKHDERPNEEYCRVE